MEGGSGRTSNVGGGYSCAGGDGDRARFGAILVIECLKYGGQDERLAGTCGRKRTGDGELVRVQTRE